jgi:hypothetical protein
MALEQQNSFPMNDNDCKEYEELEQIRYKGVVEAVCKCRKFHMGQVGFSPTIQLAMRQIRAWSFLIRKKGLKISSRLLERALKKSRPR